MPLRRGADSSSAHTDDQERYVTAQLQSTIEAAWDNREGITPASAEIREPVEQALAMLDNGTARVAEPDGKGGWQVNQWLKKAVLLSFRLRRWKSVV